MFCFLEIQVDISITVDQGETAVITFTGIGFDKRLMGTTMELTDVSHPSGVPTVQSAMLPGQVHMLVVNIAYSQTIISTATGLCM